LIRNFTLLLILILIVSTTLTKNYTKKLDDEIFSVKENISYLKNIKELVQLEHDYLSSPERLLEFNKLYFDNELKYTSYEKIKVVSDIDELRSKIMDKNE
tara:strand:+ start:938 stop:1237 length:300 start_codon:yes stop_codon:yes gene_type:complete